MRAVAYGLLGISMIGAGAFLLTTDLVVLTGTAIILAWGLIALGVLAIVVVAGQVTRTGPPLELDASGAVYRWGFVPAIPIDWADVNSAMPLGKRTITVSRRAGDDMQLKLHLCDLSSTSRNHVVDYMNQFIERPASQPGLRLLADETGRATYSWKRGRVLQAWGPMFFLGAGMSLLALSWLITGAEATSTSLRVFAPALAFTLIAGVGLAPTVWPKPIVVDSQGISIPRGPRFTATAVAWPNLMGITRQRRSQDVDRLTFDLADRKPIKFDTKALHEPERFIADIENRLGYDIPFV